MAPARSDYKAARLFLTEERGGIVIVRFAVKPVNADWSVMHSIASVAYRDYVTPLPGLPEVLEVFSRFTDEVPLP